MTSQEIDNFYGKLQQKKMVIEKFKTYAYGENWSITKADPVAKPDNRVPVPLAKAAITDVVGYAGRPGEITTEYFNITGQEPEKDDVTDILEEFDKYNREGVENSELLTTSLSLGIAWELWWVSDELELGNGLLTPEYKIVDNGEIWPIFTNSLKPKLERVIRFWNEGEGDSKVEYADVYYPYYWERYTKGKRDWSLTPPVDSEGKPIPMVYPYSKVPAIPFRASMTNSPLFAAQTKLIDSYDSLVSKTQNEVDRFNALLMLFPGGIDREFISKITEAAKPYIDNLGQFDPAQWPQYLGKDFSGVNDFYKTHGERLKEDFYNTIKVPNFMDKNFAGGDQSALAIGFKLMGFEFLVSEIEIYFRLGLETRYDMYCDILELSTMAFNKEEYEQKITWNRNLPVDDEGKLRIAAMLKGLGYSNDAINKFLPNSIVDVELEEMEDQEEEEPFNEVE